MSVEITSIARINGPTCNHFHVTVEVDSSPIIIQTNESEMEDLIDNLRALKGDMNANAFMALVWAAWKIYKRGSSKAGVLNKDIDL